MSQAVAHEDISRPPRPYRWLMLTEAVRLATSPQIILLSLVGVVVVWYCWLLSGTLFPRAVDLAGDIDVLDARLAERATAADFHRHASRWPGAAGPAEGLSRLAADFLPDAWQYRAPIDPVVGVPYRLVEPFRRLFDADNSWSAIGYLLLGGISSLAVWALIGGAISRTAVIRFGLEQRLSLRESLGFALRKWPAYFMAPALPLIGIALMAFPLIVLGWIMRLNVGVVIVGLLWLFVLVSGLLMALLALGLLFGWPLMWGTISTENSDSFDAISRSYAYTFQRPLHYLFYAAVGAVLGTLGWLLAWGFSELVVQLGFWGVSWGAGSERLREIQSALAVGAEEQTVLWLGARIIQGFVGLARAAASAFSFAYFWCVASAAYLLLRQDTDQTDLDDVVVKDGPDDGVEFGLPPLEPDEAGVPGVPGDEEAAIREASNA